MSNPKEVLVMTIDIGDGRQDTITILETDDPLVLAQRFSSKHNLDPASQESLLSLIIENLHMLQKKPEEQNPDWVSATNPSNLSVSSKAAKKGSVYDRINNQLKKNNTTMNSELNKSRSSAAFNYGEYLYLKGLQQKEEQKKISEMKAGELKETDLSELTFTPCINKNTSVKSQRPDGRAEQVLWQKGKEYQEKLEKKKQDIESETLKECKFKPKINKNLQVSRSGDVHESLFGQAEKLKEKQLKKLEDDMGQYSFKPKVDYTKKKDSAETKDQVFDRLDSSKKNFYELQKEKKKKLENVEFDEKTGQKLYTPKINKPAEKRQIAAPVWDVLYSKNDSKIKELDKLKLEQEKLAQETSETKKVCEGSDRIFYEFRKRQYERLFRLLDSDEDGVISQNSIRIDQVDIRALEILTPFFEDLQNSDQEVNFDQFCSQMDVLFKSLNVEQRAALLRKENKVSVEEVDRKPAISQNSVLLAEKKRKTLPTDLYERLTAATKATEMKVQKIKEEQEKEIIKECTFKPQLN